MPKAENPVKDKPSKRTNKINEITKIAYDQYFDYIDFREKPASENFIMRLGQEWIDWCFNSKGLKASQFFKSKGLDSRTYYRWMDKYSKFKDAYYYGLEILGDKREQGAIEKKYEVSMIKHRMHAYDPEWIKSDEYHSKLRTDAQEEKKVIIELHDLTKQEE